ncbi:MAG: serine protease [Microthrixaceae bacterium]
MASRLPTRCCGARVRRRADPLHRGRRTGVLIGLVVAIGLVMSVLARPERRADSAGAEAVVSVEARTCEGTRWATGVILRGRVATNRHVVQGASEVVVRGDGWERIGRSWATADDLDLASVVVDDPPPGLHLSPTDPTESGVRAVDEDRMDPSTVDRGIGRSTLVSRSPRDHRRSTVSTRVVASTPGLPPEEPATILWLGTAVLPGQSGSPLIDRDGRVAAMVFARSRLTGQAMALAAPAIAARFDRLRSVAPAHCG